MFVLLNYAVAFFMVMFEYYNIVCCPNSHMPLLYQEAQMPCSVLTFHSLI